MPIVIENIHRYTLTFVKGSLIISDMSIHHDLVENKKKENIGLEITKKV